MVREDVSWSRSGSGARFQDRVGPSGRVQGRNDGWRDWKSGGLGSVQSEEEEMEGLQKPEFMKSCHVKKKNVKEKRSSLWSSGAAKNQLLQLLYEEDTGGVGLAAHQRSRLDSGCCLIVSPCIGGFNVDDGRQRESLTVHHLA